MDSRKAIWTIAGILAIMVAVSAVRVTVPDRATARQLLGTEVSIEPLECIDARDRGCGCEYDLPEVVARDNAAIDEPFEIPVRLYYLENGERAAENTLIQVASENERDQETAVRAECRRIWTEAQARRETIDEMVIQPTRTLRIYDYIKDIWLGTGTEPTGQTP